MQIVSQLTGRSFKACYFIYSSLLCEHNEQCLDSIKKPQKTKSWAFRVSRKSSLKASHKLSFHIQKTIRTSSFGNTCDSWASDFKHEYFLTVTFTSRTDFPYLSRQCNQLLKCGLIYGAVKWRIWWEENWSQKEVGEWKSGMNRHPEYLEMQWDSLGLWAWTLRRSLPVGWWRYQGTRLDHSRNHLLFPP